MATYGMNNDSSWAQTGMGASAWMPQSGMGGMTSGGMNSGNQMQVMAVQHGNQTYIIQIGAATIDRGLPMMIISFASDMCGCSRYDNCMQSI